MAHQTLAAMDDTIRTGSTDSTPRRQPFTMEEVGFFEGTEKLLEMWFSLPDGCVKSRGLRDLPR